MKNLFKTLTIISVLAAAGVFTTSTLRAQTATIPLVVAPATQVLTVDPGKSVGFAVKFYNAGVDPVSGIFKVADFIVSDNKGSADLLEGPTALSDRYAASQWVSLSTEKGTIPATDMVIINGVLKVPKNANPGGRYFAVYFESASNTPQNSGARQEGAAIITQRIAGLVYVRVSGPISESASVIKFTAPGFSEYGPINITTEIKNGGDYHITPKGQITVKNMFGQEVAMADLTTANIFPNASRIIDTKVGTKWMIGKFTASLNATYGESNKALASTLSFWVFPWKLAVIIILGIIILALIIFIIFNKFVKKEKKLEQELTEEKEELEKLKESLKDKITGIIPESKVESPSTEVKKD